jgi:ribosome modulation factor
MTKIEMIPDLEKIFAQGQQACIDGEKLSDNPYKGVKMNAYDYWQNGYIKQQNEPIKNSRLC